MYMIFLLPIIIINTVIIIITPCMLIIYFGTLIMH